MLDNNKLNKRIKKIFKELKDKWRITLYRIAVESNIPHSSLKYMLDGRFEWKLNHLLSIIDFLNRYNTKISLRDLLDFDNKKSLSQIMNTENADFRMAFRKIKLIPQKPANKIKESIDYKAESEGLTKDIAEVIEESLLFKNNKIKVGIKINGKNFDFQKNISFSNEKKSKI